MNVITLQVNISLQLENLRVEDLKRIQQILKFGEERLDNAKVIELLALDRRPLAVTSIPVSIPQSMPGEIIQDTVTIDIIA